MTSTYSVLQRITAKRATAPPGERCEMCAVPIGDEHGHVVDLTGRQLMCTCRGCYLLFTDQTADLRYRAVPDRYLAFPDFRLSQGSWDGLDIPVGLAFFFRNSVQERMIAFYPGPAGATESELSLDAWNDVCAAEPRTSELLDDIEALLVRMPGPDVFLLPIDACYEFVGNLRTMWRGFDGGSDVRRYIDSFFERIRVRAKVVT